MTAPRIQYIIILPVSVVSSLKTRIAMLESNDKAKEIGALKKAKDSIVIDTTKLTIEEVVEKIIEIIKNKNSRL